MRSSTVWRRLLGLGKAIVEDAQLEESGVVVGVRLPRRLRHRCGICARPAPRYDQGRGRARWRALDLGATPAFIEAEVGRVDCPEHGVTTAAVPWAEHGSRFTREFEDQVAWLAVECSKTAVAALMSVAWLSIGRILVRVSGRLEDGHDRLAGLRRIGIDEISWRKGQRYLIVVVDHDRRRLVWATEGRDRQALDRFFFELGPQRCRQISQVSADAASWIAQAVEEFCPQAVRCLDPFHVIAWATEALDQIRRQVWNQARHDGRPEHARHLKHSRWALWKNADDLTPRQQHKLRWIERVNQPLYRAYLLKEQLRLILQLPLIEALELLQHWLSWAWRSGLEPFIALGDRIVRHLDALIATLDNGLSNALVEATNTRIRLIARRAYGFHSAQPLIALAMLSCGDHRPRLPRRP